MAEDGVSAQELLNQALKEDALGDSYVRKYKLRPEIDVSDPSRFCVSLSTTRSVTLSITS